MYFPFCTYVIFLGCSSFLSKVKCIEGEAVGVEVLEDGPPHSLAEGLAVGVEGIGCDESKDLFLIFCSSQLKPLISWAKRCPRPSSCSFFRLTWVCWSTEHLLPRSVDDTLPYLKHTFCHNRERTQKI